MPLLPGMSIEMFKAFLDILCNAVACLSSFILAYYIPCGFGLGEKNLTPRKGTCRENDAS